MPLPIGLITICDKFRKLVFHQLEAEIRWKTLLIALDCLIQGSRLYAIQLGNIPIQHDLNAADCPDSLPNLQFPDGAFYQFLLHVFLSLVLVIHRRRLSQKQRKLWLQHRYFFVTFS